MERREFIMAAVAGGTILASTQLKADEPKGPKETRRGDMLYRQLGRTGVEVSAIGMGGHHIGLIETEEASIQLIRSAIDGGITFMDNSWDYHNGKSETWMGKALRDGYRDKVFLMTKIDGRTKTAAAKQIDESLKRLQTDHIDLLQHHENIRMEDADRIFGEDGAQEAVLAAKKAGKIRFVGFTGHKDPQVHLRMIEVADKHDYHFDTAQMPINVMDAHFRSFRKVVVPELLKREIALLGMKPIASGAILKSKTVTAPECLRFALSQPTSVVITGIDRPEILKQALTVAKEFKPLTVDEEKDLLARTAKAAADGHFERFKTSNEFDSTAKHPEWLG